jgi:hypothetical protein
MSRLTPESIRASQAELPPFGTVITELRRQDPYIQQEQHRNRSPRGFQHCVPELRARSSRWCNWRDGDSRCLPIPYQLQACCPARFQQRLLPTGRRSVHPPADQSQRGLRGMGYLQVIR